MSKQGLKPARRLQPCPAAAADNGNADSADRHDWKTVKQYGGEGWPFTMYEGVCQGCGERRLQPFWQTGRRGETTYLPPEPAPAGA